MNEWIYGFPTDPRTLKKFIVIFGMQVLWIISSTDWLIDPLTEWVKDDFILF